MEKTILKTIWPQWPGGEYEVDSENTNQFMIDLKCSISFEGSKTEVFLNFMRIKAKMVRDEQVIGSVYIKQWFEREEK